MNRRFSINYWAYGERLTRHYDVSAAMALDDIKDYLERIISRYDNARFSIADNDGTFEVEYIPNKNTYRMKTYSPMVQGVKLKISESEHTYEELIDHFTKWIDCIEK